MKQDQICALLGIRQRREVIPYRRFGITCRSHQGSNSPRRGPQTATTRCVKTQKNADLSYLVAEAWNQGSRGVSCGRTDMAKLIVAFRNFANVCGVLMQAEARFSLHKDTTPPQPNHTATPTHIELEQYNTRNKSTISRKLLKMDVLIFETCWAVNGEIIKQVTSSWSIFIQLSRWCTVR